MPRTDISHKYMNNMLSEQNQTASSNKARCAWLFIIKYTVYKQRNFTITWIFRSALLYCNFTVTSLVASQLVIVFRDNTLYTTCSAAHSGCLPQQSCTDQNSWRKVNTGHKFNCKCDHLFSAPRGQRSSLHCSGHKLRNTYFRLCGAVVGCHAAQMCRRAVRGRFCKLILMRNKKRETNYFYLRLHTNFLHLEATVPFINELVSCVCTEVSQRSKSFLIQPTVSETDVTSEFPDAKKIVRIMSNSSR